MGLVRRLINNGLVRTHVSCVLQEIKSKNSQRCLRARSQIAFY